MIRQQIKGFLHRTGILRMVANRNPDGVTILLYHGVCRPEDDPRWRNGKGKFTPVDLFEKQIRVCRDYGTVVPLSHILGVAALPPNPIVLTFDDGYLNNFSLLYPLLRKYEIPATIFLTTGFLDKEVFLWMDWFDQVVCKVPSGTQELQIGKRTCFLDFRTEEAREATRVEVRKRLKLEPIAEIHRFLRYLQERTGVALGWGDVPESILPLEWDHVREMERSGLVQFGAHTVTHPILSRCGIEQQTREILDSKKRIEEETGRTCISFAYPNGQCDDYTEETVGILRKCGFALGLTAERGFVHSDESGPYQLPRWGYPRTDVDLAVLLSIQKRGVTAGA